MNQILPDFSLSISQSRTLFLSSNLKKFNLFTFVDYLFIAFLRIRLPPRSTSITSPSSRKWVLNYRSCGWVGFVPRFSDRSALLVNRYGLGLPAPISSRNGSGLLAGGQLAMWSRGGCPRERAQYSCSWKPTTRLLPIRSLIRRLAPRSGYGWSCRSISPKHRSPSFWYWAI